MTQSFVVVEILLFRPRSSFLSWWQRKGLFSHFLSISPPPVQVSDVKSGRNAELTHLLSCFFLDCLHLLNKLLVYFPTA